MSGRVFFGVILIILGAAFLLDQLNIVEFGSLIGTYWPLILIVTGAYNLLKKNIRPISGLILIFIGAFFQLKELELLSSDVWRYFWPVLLIVIGLGIIFSQNYRAKVPAMSEDAVDYFTIFSILNIRNNSKRFRGGNIFTLFGGVELDLRDAELAEDKARLELIAAFGGIDIKVPEHWRVIVSGIPLFGGWENKTRLKDISKDRNAPVLQVRCLALFGGVEIKN